jgi:alkylation response protein AidB-like acyl-CoA dehydrogenase
VNGHYRSNLRDMEFVLFELLDSLQYYGRPPFGEIDRGAASTVLAEAERYATERLARTFSDAGGERLAFDAERHSVRLPKAFRETALDYLESGWLDLEFPAPEGGEAVPPSLRWCVAELMLGANPPVPMGLNVIPQVVRLLATHGTARQQRLAELVRDRRWMVTMVLTEPDAGSDVGAARTRAYPQPDGSWHIEGVKRFITYGDHDLTGNIIHLVLARPAGVAAAGGPGTRGLSLFVVPKFHIDLTTGECLGRNGVWATGLEHKLGLTVNPTCELTFGGDGTPAVGWLLGDRHAGIAQMFEIIKHVRMLVGVKAMSALSTGYLNALDYAKSRVQGLPIAQAAGQPAAPPAPVAIVEHPDIRRSLLSQKAHAEGMRALILYAASQQDKAEMSRCTDAFDQAADARHQLLLPVIKGYCSEVAWQLLGQESLQVFGGSGYLKDYPLEQYVRDTKVDTLYEGTTGIQALDLVGRKIVRDGRAALDGLLAEMSAATAPGLSGFEAERGLLHSSLADFGELATLVAGRWESPGPGGRALAAQDCTPLLLCLGDLVIGWLWLRACVTAQAALPASEAGRPFYLGKIAAGRWFIRHALPRISATLAGARSATSDVTDLPAAAL